MKKNKTMTMVITAVCLILGIVIAIQFKAVAANRQNAGEQNKTLEELRVQLIHELNTRDSLENEIKSLNDKIKILEESALSEQEDIIKEEYRKARMIGGLTNVSGSGIVITIGEDANRILRVEMLLQLINDLRMAGAQAISINDERIVAMSEIAKGDYFIVVNGNTVAAPYIIKAVGNTDSMLTMINVPQGIITKLEEADWLVNVESANEIQIPKIKEGSRAIKTDDLKDGAN